MKQPARAAVRPLSAGVLRLVLVACLVLAGALPAVSLAASTGAAPPREALRERVEALRSDSSPTVDAHRAARALIAGLYEARGFEPLWTDAGRVESLRRAVDASVTHGLDPRDYHAPALDLAPVPGDGRALAQRELLLTDALVRLAYHLHFGKADPRALQPSWNFARTLGGADPAAALAQLASAPDPADALERLAPSLPAYADLRRVLAVLRETERRGGWTPVPAGPKLEAGMTERSDDPRLTALRKRLAESGDLAAAVNGAAAPAPSNAAPAELFDAALAEAVRRFQARHGLQVDGVVGRETLAALDVPVAARIDQVRANLERLRWVARDLVGDHLLVDIAGFEARLWLDGREAWRSRVVVGRPYRRTPEFRSTMEYLVLNPEWGVPPTILRNDVLPRVLRDRGYLERQRMRLIDRARRVVDPAGGDWAAGRERPGPGGGARGAGGGAAGGGGAPGRGGAPPGRASTGRPCASAPAPSPTALSRPAARPTRSAASASWHPTNTWCSCTTRRRANCSSARCAPSARAASASSARRRWPCCCSTMPNAGARSGSPRP